MYKIIYTKSANSHYSVWLYSSQYAKNAKIHFRRKHKYAKNYSYVKYICTYETYEI